MQIRDTHKLSMHKAGFFCFFNITSTWQSISLKKLRALRRFTKWESDFIFVEVFLYTLYYMTEL